MDEARELRAIPIRGMGEIRPGDSVAQSILEALARQKQKLVAGDILVIKHKIVSKAEGQVVRLDSVPASPGTMHWARRFGLDAKVVELATRQAWRIVRRGHGILISQTRHGLVCANSGVDLSNVDGGKSAVLLPENPDRSAQQIARALKQKLGISVPVIISDSFGRPWREGLCEVAIGLAGMKPFRDYRGRRDAHGYRMQATLEAAADELACMAGLACGKLSRCPACIIRGFAYNPGRGTARAIIRPASRDLFR
jgi:coenzyme F420-0:L-glutamate ligase/coenzyme F420-1:gamma-L-glutamate ligase